jgi:hypothetical protein
MQQATKVNAEEKKKLQTLTTNINSERILYPLFHYESKFNLLLQLLDTVSHSETTFCYE